MIVYRIFDVFNGSEADEGSRKMNLKPFENFILYVSLILRKKQSKTVYSCWFKSELIAIKEQPACDLN